MRSAILSLTVFGMVNAAYAAETQWAPPNVVGMPGYHETVKRPDSKEMPTPKSEIMNWNIIAGNWKQFSGRIKQKWGQLTDDELVQINGQREQLEGMLQSEYGYSREQAQRESTIGCRRRRIKAGAASDFFVDRHKVVSI